MTGYEFRQIVNHRRGPKHRTLTKYDMGPGERNKSLHVRSPWAFVRKPLNETPSRWPKNSVPIAQDLAGIHYVFKTIEREQHIKGLVRDGERIRGTDGEVDKNAFWNPRLNKPRMAPLNRRGVNIYPDDSPWALFRSKKKCELPIAATEIKHVFPRNIRIGKCVPTPGQRITPPNLIRIILDRPLLWAPHEASA